MIMIAFRVSREHPLLLLVYVDVHTFTHCFPYRGPSILEIEFPSLIVLGHLTTATTQGITILG